MEAAFGMILVESKHKGDASYDSVAGLAKDSLGQDERGYRRGFLEVVEKARALATQKG